MGGAWLFTCDRAEWILRAAHCFGYSNRITREIVTPDTSLRLASVSKPITSTAVHLLIEQGRLALTDLVFGAGGILGTTFGTQPYSARVLQITVQHLLEHSAGGWANDGADPMFQQPGLSQADLISWTLDNAPLTSDPGTAYAYSNFGYCLLGRIFERVSGLSYGDFVRQSVLNPAGASQMVLAGRAPPNAHTRKRCISGCFLQPLTDFASIAWTPMAAGSVHRRMCSLSLNGGHAHTSSRTSCSPQRLPG